MPILLYGLEVYSLSKRKLSSLDVTNEIIQNIQYTLCLKKFPTFKISVVTLSNLSRFSKIRTAGKRMKFATKLMQNYPPHLRHVATLPWDIKNSDFL